MTKKFSFRRVMLAVLATLLAVCAAFTLLSVKGKTAFAADFSYQEGRDGYSYNADGSLTVKFTVTGGGQEIGSAFNTWIVYLIHENTGITYNPTTHKYTDNSDRGSNVAAYYFPVDSTGQTGADSHTVTVASNAIAYRGSPSSATNYGTNTGKTFAEVFETENWIVGVGPMFDAWWGSGVAAPIDYYVGRATDVLANTVTFRNYDESVISSSSLSPSADITIPAYTALDANAYEFLGWYCDKTDKIYSAAQIADLKVSDVVDSTRSVNFYAAYNQKFSKYIEFTTSAVGTDDVADGDDNKLSKIVDTTDNVADTITVVYDITHNDGVNEILLIPEYDREVFSIASVESVSVKNDTVLGVAEIGTDGRYAIELGSTTLYNELDASFITITFTIDESKVATAEYTFGLKLYSRTANDSSKAIYKDDGGNIYDMGIVVKTKTLALSAIKDSTIRSRSHTFTYSKQAVTAACVDNYTHYEYNNSALTVYFDYDGDATTFSYAWYAADGETPIDAPMTVGNYYLDVTAPKTFLYKATTKRIQFSIVRREITVDIDDKSSVYLNGLVPLTYSVDGTVYAGDKLNISVSTTATPSSDVGNYPISGSYSNSQYIVTFNDGTYEITARPITITAIDQSATYNGNEPTVVQSEYTASETLPYGVTVVLTKELGVNVGTYEITVSSDISSNYDVSYIPALFTITSVNNGQSYFTPFFAGKTLTYNGETQDLLEVDDIPAWFTYQATNNLQVNVNTYIITITVNLTEQNAANYTAGVQQFVFTVNGEITPKAITVSAVNKEVYYGANTHLPFVPQFTVDGTTEEIDYTYAIKDNGVAFTPAADTAVGVYDIVITAGNNPNFSITWNNGTYTVLKATATASVTVNDVYYNRALNNSAAASVNTIALTPTITYYSDSACTQAIVPVNAGIYYAKATVAETGNYYGAEDVKPFEILKIQLSAPTVVSYDGATVTLSEVITDVGGLALKDGTVVSYTINSVDCTSNRSYTATSTGAFAYVIDSNNSNYIAYEETTEICYSIAFAEGSHAYNPVVLEVPATLYCFNTSSVILPAALNLDGYNFVSWDGHNAESAYAPSANVTLDAIWSAIGYTVSFKYTESGEIAYSNTFYYGQAVTYPTATVVPVKDSDNAGIYYSFADKWTKDATEYAFTTEEGIATVTGVNVYGDMVFVAVFDTNYNTFTLTYYVSQNEATTGYVQFGETQVLSYGAVITYLSYTSNYQWFKTDFWYLDAARTQSVPVTMPNANIEVYGSYKFDIGTGDVNADGIVNADDITLYRQWIVGGYEMTVVENGDEWDTALSYNANTRYFFKRVADINADSSKDIRDVSITRMSIVDGYNWDIITGENVSGAEIVRTYQSITVNEIASRLNSGKRVILGDNIEDVNGVIEVNFSGNVYIDLNGKTLTVYSFAVNTDKKDATIIVKNGTIITTNGITVTAPNGNVILEGLTGYVGNTQVNLQAANSSLHLAGEVAFYKEAGSTADENVAPIHVEEGTHIVIEQEAVLTVEKIVVTENFVATSTAGVTLDNQTVNEVVIEGVIENTITSLAELIDAKNCGGDYILGADISYNGILYFAKDTSINLNGYTLRSLNNCAMYVTSGATLVISGNGNIIAQEACIVAFDGSTIVINGGTYTSIDNFVIGTNGSTGRGNNNITINTGTFNGGITSNGYVACGIYVANNDTVKVKAGTFNITNGCGILARSGNTTVSEGVVINVTGNGSTGKVGDSKVTVPSGAALVLDLAANYPGGTPVLVNNGEYAVDTVINEIGELVAAMNNGGNYVLAADISYNGILYFAKDTSINLNGYTLRSLNNCAMYVTSGATLTLNGNGNVIAQEACVVAFDGSTVVINGGTYTAIDNFVIGTNGSKGKGNNNITINAGTFNGGITSANYVACGIYVANDDTVVVNGGTFNITNGCGILARSGNTTIKSGVVFNMLGENNMTGKVGDSRVVVPAGEALVLDLKAAYPGGVPTINNETDIDVYAIVDGTYTFANDDASFHAARGVYDNVILSGDFNDYLYITKDMNVYLNGHTVDASATSYVAIYVVDGAKVTINGNGLVKSTEGCVIALDGSEFTINGGEYICYDNFVFGTNGSDGRGDNKITVNAGTFNGQIVSEGYVACGIYVANNDTVVVNGGTFNITNGCGILARSGNTTVGAEVVINVTGDSTLGKVGDSKVVVPTGEELVLDLAANYPGGAPTITNNSEYAVYTVSAN